MYVFVVEVSHIRNEHGEITLGLVVFHTILCLCFKIRFHLAIITFQGCYIGTRYSVPIATSCHALFPFIAYVKITLALDSPWKLSHCKKKTFSIKGPTEMKLYLVWHCWCNSFIKISLIVWCFSCTFLFASSLFVFFFVFFVDNRQERED